MLRVNQLRVGEIVHRYYDLDAQNYFTRIELAGSSISKVEKEAINIFILAAKTHGYWNDLDRINIFCGTSLAGAMVPLKIGGGNSVDVLNGFDNGGDQPPATFYSPGYGLKCNNDPSGYIDTNWNPSSKGTNNSTHHAFYIRSQVADNAGIIGIANGSDRFALTLPTTNGTYLSDQYDASNGRITTSSVNADGFIIATRTASNAHTVYRNGTSIGNNSTSGGSLPNGNFYIGALNNGGAGSYSKHTLGAYSLGLGLDSTKTTNYSIDMENLQVALGRGTQDIGNENFERGVRPPNVFDNSSDFDYSTSPISGTYSLRQIEGSYLVFFPPRIEEPEIYVKFRFKPEILPDPSSIFFQFLSSGAIERLALILNLNGTVSISSGGISASTTATMSADTIYYVWCYIKKGTGSNSEARVWFSSSNSRPSDGSTSSAGGTNGTITVNTDGIVLLCGAATNNNPVFVFDELRAKTIDFS